MAILLTGLFVAVVLWIVRARLVARQRLQMPYLNFEGDNSPMRYTQQSTSLLDVGYEKYLKKGIPFAMRNPIDETRPQVVMPMKYLAETKNAPERRLSFPLFSEKAFSLNEVHGPKQTDEAAHVIRIDVNKALNDLIGPMHEQCIKAFAKAAPPCSDWTPVPPYHILVYAIARITALVLVGAELCENDEWAGQSIQTTIQVMMASQSVKAKWHPWFRWIAKYFDEPTKVVVQNRKRAAELLAPVLEQRKAAIDLKSKGGQLQYQDAVQWLLEQYRGQGKTLTPEILAQDELFLTIASTHSTGGTTLSTLFDLIDRPEAMTEIIEEIHRAHAKHNGWTRQALNELWLLDSFMRESQRVHSLGLVTMTRTAVSDFTFKDGLRIPAGTQLSFPNQHTNWDDDVHVNAKTFDAKRWSSKRETIDPNKFHFGSVSEDSINFGAGFHACPGRFFAQQVIKLVLIQFLTEFDIKWADKDGKRPPEMVNDFSISPNAEAQILIRRKMK